MEGDLDDGNSSQPVNQGFWKTEPQVCGYSRFGGMISLSESRLAGAT
jgi:hypothetical protein